MQAHVRAVCESRSDGSHEGKWGMLQKSLYPLRKRDTTCITYRVQMNGPLSMNDTFGAISGQGQILPTRHTKQPSRALNPYNRTERNPPSRAWQARGCNISGMQKECHYSRRNKRRCYMRNGYASVSGICVLNQTAAVALPYAYAMRHS